MAIQTLEPLVTQTSKSEEKEMELHQLEASLLRLRDVFRLHQQYISQKYDVSQTELDIISLIAVRGKKKMKEIAENFSIRFSTLTSVVDGLESKGLVRRVHSKTDRRAIFVELSAKGRILHENYALHIKGMARLMKRNIREDRFELFVEELVAITDKTLHTA